MNRTLAAHLALLGVNLIYGANYIIAKGVMPDYIGPLGFVFVRGVGALVLFWSLHRFISSERVERNDMVRMALCGLFGVACNQLLFFSGLNLTSPINAAIIMTSTPILVLLASSLLLREAITRFKVGGIALGLTGALLIIFFKQGSASFGSATLLGDVFILVNAISYSVYLVIVKPLMRKYEPLTVIKWVFLFGFVVVGPVGVGEFTEVPFAELPQHVWGAIAFVVLGTTFLAYLLNIFALKHVSPTLVSTYIYLQPLLAAFFAILAGQDQLDLVKVAAAALIFAGVFLVSRPAPAKASGTKI